jgi:hypothetical protein
MTKRGQHEEDEVFYYVFINFWFIVQFVSRKFVSKYVCNLRLFMQLPQHRTEWSVAGLTGLAGRTATQILSATRPKRIELEHLDQQ